MKMLNRLYFREIFKNVNRTFYCSKSKFSTAEENQKYVISNEENGVRSITLNQPKTRNALSLEMMSILKDSISNDKDNPSLRVIVLSATGSVFSAGHNLKELTMNNGIEYHRCVFQKATELMTSIITSPVPVVAKVNGLAAAAGCQLVATCDIILCSKHSTFSTPGANFGIFCSTPGIAIGRSLPKSTAMNMLLTGFPISSEEAYNSGLITKVVSEEQLDIEVKKVCDAIIAKSRQVVSLGKEFYYKQMSKGIFEAYKLGEEIMVKNINMPDGQEGINSFSQKRKPSWNQ